MLVQWHGDPIPPPLAEQWSRVAAERLARRGRNGVTAFTMVMQQMIADWWLDDSQYIYPMRGLLYASTRRKLALYHLIAGQLLISCKLASAMDYLDMGLRHADGLISAEHYFKLYNRHEELRFLSLSTSRQKPRSLRELLNESRVMRKLIPNSGYSIPRTS